MPPIQPENLIGDVTTRPVMPIRIEPAIHGGSQSRKFAAVASATTLVIGTPVAFNVALDAFVPWDPETGEAAVANEVQEINMGAGADGGTFTLAFKGEVTTAIAFNASAATIETAFELLSTVGAGNGTVSGGTLPGTPVLITFTGALAGAAQPLVVIDPALLSDGGVFNVGATVTPVTAGGSGKVNEVQTVTYDGTPTSGSFTLTFDGQTTAPIDFDADGAAVTLALEALSNIGDGNVVATGAAEGPWTVTFGGDLAGAALPQLSANDAALLPAEEQGITIATTVQGAADADVPAAPAGEIEGFIVANDLVLSTLGEVFGTIMFKGLIHFDDITLPPGSTATVAQLAAACRVGLLDKGILVDGLSGVR